VKSTNYEAPRYAAFFTLPSLHEQFSKFCLNFFLRTFYCWNKNFIGVQIFCLLISPITIGIIETSPFMWLSHITIGVIETSPFMWLSHITIGVIETSPIMWLLAGALSSSGTPQ
jgi:hypothetical protein